MQAQTEVRRAYETDTSTSDVAKKLDDDTIADAMKIIAKRLRVKGQRMLCTEDTAGYLILKLATEPREHFGVLFFDCDMCLIEDFMPFQGTIDHVDAPVREILKRALEVGADSMVCYHNHPSQNPEASASDKDLTQWLVKAAKVFNIHLYDHIIVGGLSWFSFAREGLR